MKKLTSIAIAFLLVLSVVPAMAADQANSDREPVTSQAVDKVPVTFQAFSNLPATEREALTPLTETELASIEGSSDICFGACVNFAYVTQVNVFTCTACANFINRQTNDSDIFQRIN